MRERGLRPSGALLAAALLLVGCGSSTASSGLTEDQILRQVADRACHWMARCGVTSSQMVFTVTPAAGPAGTLVSLKVAGCIDPSGRHHALAYQSGQGVAIPIAATKRGNSLTATYRVAGGAGRFTATCLDTYVTRDFVATS
ncbi:MAG: hypothetical protein ACTHOG_12180 [Marmoricola sp.]